MYLLWMTASLTGSSSRGSSRPHPTKVLSLLILTCMNGEQRIRHPLDSSVSERNVLFASVTTVDSGSKALELLGLREDQDISSPSSPDKNVSQIVHRFHSMGSSRF